MTHRILVLAAIFAVLVAGCSEAPAPPAPAALQEQSQDLAPVASPALPAPSAAGRTATLYRDTWGVPHIYADTLADAAYAMGYAQAEDRLEDIYASIRTAIGRMAEAYGPSHAETDYVLQLARNAEDCEEYWKTAPPHIRELGDGFVRGVEAYLAEHPERRPESGLELAGWHCAAVGRAMILRWPLGTIQGDLRSKKEAPPFGSNAFAVAPSRSADKSAILMTDPHLTWEGLAVFYEARVHAPGFDLCGYWLVGSPLPALGHNGHVAWACTTGGPDTSDVYMVKLNPSNLFQYEYNGEWRTFESRTITVNVKGESPRVKPALYSLYGPVVEEPDTTRNVAYCGASPYLDEAGGVFEQMYRMAAATSGEEFSQALGMNYFMEQNILFADRQGNIQYVRNGRTPIRPDGYNWSAPVPGGSDATRWLGIHGIGDLVQVKNPPQGYFENCNVSPQLMMRDSPMTPDKYKPYIYNVSWDRDSPRGARLRELLDADAHITREAALAYMTDVYDRLSAPWKAALEAAIAPGGVAALREKDAELAGAVDCILQWDGRFVPESAAAPIVRFWREKCEPQVDVVAIAEGKALDAEQQVRMLGLLRETLDEMKSHYGSLEVTWGDVNLIGRSGRYYPCPGAEFGGGKDKKNFTETVFDVRGREEPNGSGRYIANNGSGSLLIAFLYPDRIESFSLVAWGQSADPASPHHVDQAEKLYSRRTLKPTWFERQELMQNLESERTLTIP